MANDNVVIVAMAAATGDVVARVRLVSIFGRRMRVVWMRAWIW
jgi:hypothetical protein